MSLTGDARRTYLNRMSARKHEFEDRKEELIAGDPVLSGLVRGINGVFLEALKGHCTLEEADRKSDELQQELERAAEERGLSDKVLDYVPLCPICSDTGYVEGRQCSCLTSFIMKYSFGSNTDMRIYSLNDFIPEIYTKQEDRERAEVIKEKVKNFIDNFDTDRTNIALLGVAGSGKTHLSYIICDELVRQGYNVLHTRVPELIKAMSSDIYSDEREDFTAMAESCDFLVLDDLGTERQTDFVQLLLNELIDARYRSGRPTMITTNISIKKQKEMYGDRIISRFYSQSRINCIMPEEDIRLKLRK